MQAPTSSQLRREPIGQQTIEEAWTDSLPGDPSQRHEEGGWVYMDPATGVIATRRASAGSRAMLDLNSPPLLAGSVVAATFHTHPNPSVEGWAPGPSDA